MKGPRIGVGAQSRRFKKQIIAYLLPDQAEAAYARTHSEGKTNQEIIGEAVNAVLASQGRMPLMPSGHHRIIRRTKGRAEKRTGEGTPSCRRGTISFSGWFDRDVVDRLNTHLAEMDMSVQTVIERGLVMITGVEPVPRESWLAFERDDEPGEDGGGADAEAPQEDAVVQTPPPG